MDESKFIDIAFNEFCKIDKIQSYSEKFEKDVKHLIKQIIVFGKEKQFNQDRKV